MITIGEQIKILTDEVTSQKKFQKSALVRGLCTRGTFRKIVDGSVSVDLNLIRILIQRLGKSPNKLEVIVSKEMLDAEMQQLYFDESIDLDDGGSAKRLLEWFKNDRDRANDNRVKKMTYFRNLACYEHYINKDYAKAEEYIEKAIDTTLPGWKTEGFTQLVISTVELENLLEYGLLKFVMQYGPGDFNEGLKFTDSVMGYIEARVTDDEERASILPKCHYLKAQILLKEGRTEQALIQCEAGVGHLRKYKRLQLMLPFIDLILRYGKDVMLSGSYERYSEYGRTLREIIDEYGFSSYKYDSFFLRCKRMTFHCDTEIYSAQRKMKGMSQEKVSELADLDPAMVSKYETGKHSPNKTNFPKIMKALGLEWGRMSTTMACEDFTLLEKEQEIRMLVNNEDYDKASELIRDLESGLDPEFIQNRMTLKCLQNFLFMSTRDKTPGQVFEEDEAVLRETFPDFDKAIPRVPLACEARLLNQIVICLHQQGKNREATLIYNNLISAIENSYVDVGLRTRLYGLFLGNYAKTTASIKMSEKGIKYKIKCRDLTALEAFISSAASQYAAEDKVKWKRMMYQALFISGLLQKEKNYTRLKMYVDKYFSD